MLRDGLAGGGGEPTCVQATDTPQVLAFSTAVGYFVDIALQLWRAHVTDDDVYVMDAAAHRWVKRVRGRRDMQAKVSRLVIDVRTCLRHTVVRTSTVPFGERCGSQL
jgi:hypothetical protein